jgi:glucose uptake protein GlcU
MKGTLNYIYGLILSTLFGVIVYTGWEKDPSFIMGGLAGLVYFSTWLLSKIYYRSL